MKMKRFIVGIVLFAVAMGIQASERKKYNFNSDWLLKIGDMERQSRPSMRMEIGEGRLFLMRSMKTRLSA